ncbi:hypothetical protein Unana1_06770 [Umbelopsis nana]
MRFLAGFPELPGQYAVSCHDIEYASSDLFMDSMSVRLDDSSRTKIDTEEFTHPDVQSVYVHTYLVIVLKALCELVGIARFIANRLAAAAARKSTKFYTFTPLNDQQNVFPVVIFNHGL